MDDAFPPTVYALCFLAALLCALLLGRMYLRSRQRLVMWSSLCFALLAIANLLVIVDMMASQDLRMERLLLSLAGVGVLLFGFTWDQEN